jgi:hypothetical protein
MSHTFLRPEITMRKISITFVGSILLLTLAACGGGNQAPQFPTLPGGEAGAPAGGSGTPVNATATLKGKISFEGTPPPAAKIQMSADPYCQQNNKDAMTEEVVVSDGGLENVILYISGGLAETNFPTPTDPVLIDQKDCHYVPHVFTMQTNQPLKIKNSDATLHNIHAFSEKNTPFNIGQPVQNMETTQKFGAEEVPLPVRCDVHKWMGAFIGVFHHPFHTTSKQGGVYELKLPAGNYEITAWHEKYGKQTAMVQVADNGSADLNFTFKAPTGD